MNSFETSMILLKLKIKLQTMMISSLGIYEGGYRQGLRDVITEIETLEDPVLGNNGEPIKNPNPEVDEDQVELERLKDEK